MVLSPAAGLHEIAMNFSAVKATRKWPYGAVGRARTVLAATAAAWLVLGAPIGPAAAAQGRVQWPWSGLPGERGQPPRPRHGALRAAVPLPRPRPAEAPAAEPGKPAEDNKAAAERPAPSGEQGTAETPPPSACRRALTDAIAIAPSIADIHGPGGCGGEDLVRLEAVVLPDQRQVALRPAAILRCTMASAIADWIRSDIAPLTAGFGSVVSDLDNFELVRMPRPQPRRRCHTVRAWPRQRARCAGAGTCQRPVDLADRPHRAARVARKRAAFGVRAIFNRAGAGLRRLS